MFWKGRTISKIALDPPTPDPDRAGIAIVLIVRNEERDIAEWARFHAAVGVERVIAYDDGCTDRTLARLAAALPEGGLTIVPWHQRLKDGRSGAEIHNQVLAYAHAVRNFGAAFRWMAFIDVDEFLVPVADDDLDAALLPLGAAAQVSLPWHMFGRNGHATPPEGGILPHYTRRNDPTRARHGLNWKVIVDPARVRAVRVHGFDVDGASVNDVGTQASLGDRGRAGFYSRARIQLNHYYTRSAQELEEKLARGSTKTVAAAAHRRRVMRIVDEIEADTVEDNLARDVARRHGLIPGETEK